MILSKKIVSLVVGSSMALAATLPNMASAVVDPCALFYSLKKDASYDVVKVQVLGVQNGVAGFSVVASR